MPSEVTRSETNEGCSAGDHDRLDAHEAELGEALLDAPLDDVLQLDDPEDLRALGHDERSGAIVRHLFHLGADGLGELPPVLAT